MLIFWSKDNLGWISTTENCSFLFPFLCYTWMTKSVLRTRTFHWNKRAGRFHLTLVRCSLLHTAKDLLHPGQFTEQAMKQEIFIENICDLVMWHQQVVQICISIFSLSSPHTFFCFLVCISRLLITSEYLPKINIFMAFIRSNVFVEN